VSEVTFHDLRHTFASRLVVAGVDLPTVKELMSHKRIEMTLRYTHLSPGHKRAAMTVFDKIPTIFPTGQGDDGRQLMQAIEMGG
jgi:integrase